MKFLSLLTATLCALSLTSCSSEGGSKAATGTAVNLSGNNYRVVRAGVSGTSCGFDLLGFIPVCPPTYSGAKAAMLRHAGISMTGRSVAIANQTEDRSSLYLIAFSVPRITLTGDVVEFTGPSSQSGQTVGSIDGQ
jgi:hypothetical protein